MSLRMPNSLEFSLVAALKSISSSPSLILQGQQLHCHVIKSGVGSNVFVRNSLISMYSKMGLLPFAESIFDRSPKLDPVSCNIMLGGYVRNGRLNDARDVFVKMPVRNCVSYTTMIMGLAWNESHEEALRLFREMRFLGVVPGEVTIATVISSCARLGGFEKSPCSFHGIALKHGLDKSVLVSTNLVLLYCVNSRLDEARKIFDEISGRNVVSWNVMLNGYVKAGRFHSARELFECIPEKDVVSWGTMIDGYIQARKLTEALVLYRRMRHLGLNPNEVMIVDMISGCGEEEEEEEARRFQGKQFHVVALKMGFVSYDFMRATLIHFYGVCGETDLARLQFEEGSKNHIASWNALISGLMRNGMVHNSKKLFMDMPERDVFSWSSMISGYTQNRQPAAAVELFREMVKNGIRPNEITMASVFSAVSSLEKLDEGKWAHEYILRSSISISDNLSAAIIDMYSKCGSISSALEVFHQIREKAGDVSPWNAIICGLAMHGHGEMCLEIFSDLQKSRNLNPNSITFIGVLSACCHSGLVEAGKRCFEAMSTVHNLEPNLKHFGCMVDLLGRAGRLREAEELIRRMPMEADAVIWGTLLAACKMHGGNTEVGEMAAGNLAKVEPCHGPSRVLLSNIYADVGKWDEAFLARRVILSSRLRRSPGYSGVLCDR
ncbi:tetratricopeptide-like helical [Genlisea aurea]|uniref:Tetratricopeptide-like helical n=1 Tax=Genlisea aurea TaxID=192259 RepID=S8C1N4_9LAMI|nr:tetratricopeptide-like helical [Genlisea aurea]